MVQGGAEVTSIPLPGRKELAQDVAAFRAEVSAASGCPASCWGRRERALMGGFAPHQLSLVPPPLLGWLVEVGHSVFVKPRAFIVARLGLRHSESLFHLRRMKKSRAPATKPKSPQLVEEAVGSAAAGAVLLLSKDNHTRSYGTTKSLQVQKIRGDLSGAGGD